MAKWYRRRGGWIPRVPRTPWVRRRGPLALPPVPVQPPVRTVPIPMQKPTPVGRGRGVNQKRETAPKTEPVTGPKVSPKTEPKMRTRTRRWVPPKVRLRRRKPWDVMRPRPDKRSLTKRVRVQGAGSTFSTWTGRRPPSRYKKRQKFIANASPWRAYRLVEGKRCGDSYSKQSVLEWDVLNNTQLTIIKNSAPATADDTSHVLVNSVKTTMHMTNACEATVYVDIVEFLYRDDISKDFTTLWNDGLIDVIGGTGTTAGKFGITPFMSPVLCSYVKMQKIHTVELGQGRSHRHVSKYSYNDFFEFDKLAESATTYYGSWSRGIYLICRGGPVNDTTVKSTIVSATTALDVIFDTTVKFKYMQPMVKYLLYSNTLPTTGVTESLLDVGSGEPESLNVA